MVGFLFSFCVIVMIVLDLGCRDGIEERGDGGDGMGREHPLLVDCVQRGSIESGSRRSGLVAVAESRLVSSRLHVHDIFRFSTVHRLEGSL